MYTAVNQDNVLETQQMADNSVDMIGTSIPFDNQVAEAEMMGNTPIKNTASEAMQRIENLGHKLLEVAR